MKKMLAFGILLCAFNCLRAQNTAEKSYLLQVKKYFARGESQLPSFPGRVPSLSFLNSFSSVKGESSFGQIEARQVNLTVSAFLYAEELAPVEVKEDHLFSVMLSSREQKSAFSHLQITVTDIDFLIGSSRLYKTTFAFNLK